MQQGKWQFLGTIASRLMMLMCVLLLREAALTLLLSRVCLTDCYAG